MADRPILIEAASRPYPTETVSGDAWHVDWHAFGCRIAVIDGLGHGPGAAEAASYAHQALAGMPDADPIAALHACHAALRGTRGAAVAITTIDLGTMRLTHAGVGNVEARVRTAGRTVRLVSLRGIVGSMIPTLRAVHEPLDPDWLLLVHTDGIRDRFNVDEVAGTNAVPLRRIVDTILTTWGRATDDATVLVAAPRPLDPAQVLVEQES